LKEAEHPNDAAHAVHDTPDDKAEYRANLAKLSDEDRRLAEAQGYCVVMGEPLGSMGPPLKVMLKEQAVFICCKGCEKKALSKPDAMLAKAEELKAKVKQTEHNDAEDKQGETTQGHSHERGKMLIADAGPCHALLTAHLAEAGNELDIFLETPVDKDPQPIAIADMPFEAQATTGDGDSQTLTFEPAPAAERPAGEKAGACSHFVAKAAWLKPDDELLVVARFTIDGQEVVARWKKFVPKTFAHHVE